MMLKIREILLQCVNLPDLDNFFNEKLRIIVDIIAIILITFSKLICVFCCYTLTTQNQL